MWFLCFFVWFWVLGYFLLVAWFWDFSISLGLRVGVKFALGRDDIQSRRNVNFMVFWYAVLQLKYLILVKSEIGSRKWIFLLRIVWVCPVGFYMCVFFLVQSAYLACFKS